MPYYEFVWTTEIIGHLGEHGVSQEDFEHVVLFTRGDKCKPVHR